MAQNQRIITAKSQVPIKSTWRIFSVYPAQRTERALETMQQVKRYRTHRNHIKYNIP